MLVKNLENRSIVVESLSFARYLARLFSLFTKNCCVCVLCFVTMAHLLAKAWYSAASVDKCCMIAFTTITRANFNTCCRAMSRKIFFLSQIKCLHIIYKMYTIEKVLLLQRDKKKTRLNQFQLYIQFYSK